jgi:hypothetical protein
METNLMIDLQALRDKTVVLKVTGFTHPISGTIVNVEHAGVWISTQELPAELGQAGALIKTPLKNPVVFVPFCQIYFLVAAQG